MGGGIDLMEGRIKCLWFDEEVIVGICKNWEDFDPG
jgi:hypothetical protein